MKLRCQNGLITEGLKGQFYIRDHMRQVLHLFYWFASISFQQLKQYFVKEKFKYFSI